MKPWITRINADWIGKSLSRSGGLQSAAKLGAPLQSPLTCDGHLGVQIRPPSWLNEMMPLNGAICAIWLLQ